MPTSDRNVHENGGVLFPHRRIGIFIELCVRSFPWKMVPWLSEHRPLAGDNVVSHSFGNWVDRRSVITDIAIARDAIRSDCRCGILAGIVGHGHNFIVSGLMAAYSGLIWSVTSSPTMVGHNQTSVMRDVGHKPSDANEVDDEEGEDKNWEDNDEEVVDEATDDDDWEEVDEEEVEEDVEEEDEVEDEVKDENEEEEDFNEDDWEEVDEEEGDGDNWGVDDFRSDNDHNVVTKEEELARSVADELVAVIADIPEGGRQRS